ncbi:unnamed protein product, partial [Mycena citricolor]
MSEPPESSPPADSPSVLPAPTHTKPSRCSSTLFTAPIMPLKDHEVLELISGKLPRFHTGPLTTDILCHGENACISWFKHKDVDNNKQTLYLIELFEDPKVHLYLLADAAHINTLSTKEFFKDLTLTFLPINWDDNVCTKLMSTSMTATASFQEYANRCFKPNAQLACAGKALDPVKLCPILEAGMDRGLYTCYRKDKITKDLPFSTAYELAAWIREVHCVDEEHLEGIEKQCTIFAKFQHKNMGCKKKDKHRTMTNEEEHPAKHVLTEDKRNILHANNGCNICRKVFVGNNHQGCQNWPDALTYVPITEQTVMAAKASHAANAVKKNRKLVAIIMPNIVNDNLSFETDNSLDHSPCKQRKMMKHNQELMMLAPADVIGAVRARIETLARWEDLQKRGDALQEKYASIFEPIPHIDALPDKVTVEAGNAERTGVN